MPDNTHAAERAIRKVLNTDMSALSQDASRTGEVLLAIQALGALLAALRQAEEEKDRWERESVQLAQKLDEADKWLRRSVRQTDEANEVRSEAEARCAGLQTALREARKRFEGYASPRAGISGDTARHAIEEIDRALSGISGEAGSQDTGSDE